MDQQIERQDTFEVNAVNYGRLQADIAALAKRAVKLGGSVGMVEISRREVDRVTAYGFKVTQTLITVRITGEAPKLNGWSFVATLQHVADVGNIVRTVPGVEMPIRFRDATPEWCDQCKAKRDRLESFIVRHDDGRYAQVGRTCLKDFLGHADPYRLASLATILAEARALGEDDGWGSAGGFKADEPPTQIFMAFVAASIERNGWVPKSKAQEWNKIATAEMAAMEMAWSERYPDAAKSADANGDIGWLNIENKMERHFIPTAKQAERAATALSWTREYLDSKVASGAILSDYEFNVRAVSGTTNLIPRTMGIAASIIAYYDKQQEFARERAGRQQTNAQAAVTSEWQGTIGQRMDITAKVVSVRELDGQYGTTFVYNLEDEAGHRYSWFSSRNVLEAGETRTITATVKDHTTFRDVKQTVITRGAVSRTATEEADDLALALSLGNSLQFKGISSEVAAMVIKQVEARADWYRVEGKQSKSTKMWTLTRVARENGQPA